jgi:hypothetical protein
MRILQLGILKIFIFINADFLPMVIAVHAFIAV